jgi:hypothetical protein
MLGTLPPLSALSAGPSRAKCDDVGVLRTQSQRISDEARARVKVRQRETTAACKDSTRVQAEPAHTRPPFAAAPVVGAAPVARDVVVDKITESLEATLNGLFGFPREPVANAIGETTERAASQDDIADIDAPVSCAAEAADVQGAADAVGTDAKTNMEATEVKATGSFVEADKSDSVLSPANPAATTATEVDDVEVVAAAGAPKAVVAQGALAESAEEVQETVVVSGAGYDLDTDDYADEHIEIKHIETITGGDIAVTSTEASADKPASLEAGSVETKPAIATHADPVGHGDRPADGQTGEGTEAMNKKVVDDGLDGTNNEGGTNNEEANGDAKEDLLEAPGEAPRHASAASHSVGKSSEIGAFEELVQLLTIQAQALSMARTRTKARIVSAKRQLDDVLALLDGKDGD